MGIFIRWQFGAVLAASLLASCASPRYLAPDPVGLDPARLEATQAAYDTALTRRARVYDLAWPVLTENTEICPRTTYALGLVLADRPLRARMAGSLREEDLIALGLDDEVTVIHAHHGGPAAAAGITANMRLTSVNGEAIDRLSDANGAISDALNTDDIDADAPPAPVNLAFEAVNGEIVTADITPQYTCDMAVKVSTSQAINASAASGGIVIYTGLIRALDDPALQFVIAHEAAHLAANHHRKYTHNSLVTGAAIVGPPTYLLAGMGDALLRLTPINLDQSLTARSTRLLIPWSSDFETEADYLGAYMFARTGGDLEAASAVFDIFATEMPRSLYTRSTHPLTPERIARFDAIVAEIAEKRAAGAPLLPNER